MEDEDDGGWVDPMASLFVSDTNNGKKKSENLDSSRRRRRSTFRTSSATDDNDTTASLQLYQQQQRSSLDLPRGAQELLLFTPPPTPSRNPFLDQGNSSIPSVESDHHQHLQQPQYNDRNSNRVNDGKRGNSFSSAATTSLRGVGGRPRTNHPRTITPLPYRRVPNPPLLFSASFGHNRPFSSSAPPPPHPATASRNLSLSYVEDLCRRSRSEGDEPGVWDPLLPEFVGSRGQGIFQAPPRAALHPGRPPSLEVRPHPLRKSQSGCFLRAIACSPSHSQLWAAQESGLRFWDLNRLFSSSTTSPNSEPPKGDEETAPFRHSICTSSTLCLAVDPSRSTLIWSGHKDGKIRAWTTTLDDSPDSSSDVAPPPCCFRDDFSWQAHRGPVLSMVFTSYGDLWAGFEGGNLKIWPWESLEKLICSPPEERHVAALGLERSYVDLKAQVTVVGVCPLPSSDVKFLHFDASKSKVWSGSSLSFALWNSRTKELLKVFDIDGQVEGRLDISAAHLPYIEDEMKVKFVPTSKKEKNQGPMGFFQRSRNALMGAADAVRRAAIKGTFLDDNKRTEAMIVTMDGMIWTGCGNGALIQWNGNGNRVQEFQYHSSSVQSLCSFGTRLWVGYASGTIQILDLEGILLGEWVAHNSPIIKMAIGSGYLFTLANHGGIRGWNLASPCSFDETLRLELTKKENLFTKVENVKILVSTWNVGQERASYDSIVSWVGSAASKADVIVVGLQEVEMGAGFLAMAAAKETVGLEGSANGQWWLDTIGKTLGDGTVFWSVGSRQLAGLLITAWARQRLKRYIGDIDAGAVPCGFGRALGNKGSVGLRMRVYDRVLCFMNCHFAAHLEAVNRRNADFEHVYRSMSFSKPSAEGSSSVFQLLQVSNSTGSQCEVGKPELSEADMVVFLGDLNYRLHGVSYDEARESISQRSFDWLREKDQLRAEMKAGRVFQGSREGMITFPPTYKFEKNKTGLSGYDSGEKKRVPAWCDRILYRDSRSVTEEECTLARPTDSDKECSLRCPVISSVSQYDACMGITDSDHKPVRCLFNVDIARVDELVRRQEFGRIMSSNIEIRSISKQLSIIPEVAVSKKSITLQNRGSSMIRLTNKCDKLNAIFEIGCEGESLSNQDGSPSELHPRRAFGFPRWLEINPAVGTINPCRSVEVFIRREDFHSFEEHLNGVQENWWCEDSRDKETTLVVNVRGSFSNEGRKHLIHVQRCLS